MSSVSRSSCQAFRQRQPQRDVHGSDERLHRHRLQSPLQAHLIKSWHAFATCGISLHTGCHLPSTSVHPWSAGDGNCWIVRWLVAHTPVWYAALRACCSKASCYTSSQNYMYRYIHVWVVMYLLQLAELSRDVSVFHRTTSFAAGWLAM